jgi:hypothetical protein
LPKVTVCDSHRSGNWWEGRRLSQEKKTHRNPEIYREGDKDPERQGTEAEDRDPETGGQRPRKRRTGTRWGRRKIGERRADKRKPCKKQKGR